MLVVFCHKVRLNNRGGLKEVILSSFPPSDHSVLQDDQDIRESGRRQHLPRPVTMPCWVFLSEGFDEVWLLSSNSGKLTTTNKTCFTYLSSTEWKNKVSDDTNLLFVVHSCEGILNLGGDFHTYTPINHMIKTRYSNIVQPKELWSEGVLTRGSLKVLTTRKLVAELVCKFLDDWYISD